MRRRIVLATVSIAIAGLVVFGLPLAVVARRVVQDDALRRLDREADAIAFAIDDEVSNGGAVDRATVARVMRAGRYVVVVDPDGRRTTVGDEIEGRTITAVIRANSGTVVRITASAHDTDERALGALAVIVGLGMMGVAVAVALAIVVARRLARPLSELAGVSGRLGAGDFSARAGSYGVAEADAIANALNATARRIEDLLEAERAFSANASHQLRTPLTAMRLHVEELAAADDPAVRRDAEVALAEADRLEATIDDLLEFARRGRIGPREDVDVTALVDDRREGWQRLAAASARPIVVRSEPGCRAMASPPGLTQSLDALVDNALRHGAGTVTVTTRRHDGYAEIVVEDEGAGIPADSEGRVFERHVSLGGGSGVGLALARTLIEAEGGRLDLVRPRPAAFRILLPAPRS